jgi:hypothetical protein
MMKFRDRKKYVIKNNSEKGRSWNRKQRGKDALGLQPCRGRVKYGGFRTQKHSPWLNITLRGCTSLGNSNMLDANMAHSFLVLCSGHTRR